MDSKNFDLAMTFKRPDPFAEQRTRTVRRLALFASAILFAYVVAGISGYDLPSARAVWDRLVTVAYEIAHIPA